MYSTVIALSLPLSLLSLLGSLPPFFPSSDTSLPPFLPPLKSTNNVHVWFILVSIMFDIHSSSPNEPWSSVMKFKEDFYNSIIIKLTRFHKSCQPCGGCKLNSIIWMNYNIHCFIYNLLFVFFVVCEGAVRVAFGYFTNKVFCDAAAAWFREASFRKGGIGARHSRKRVGIDDSDPTQLGSRLQLGTF